MSDFLKSLEALEEEYTPKEEPVVKGDGDILLISQSKIKDMCWYGEYQSQDGELYYCPLMYKEVTLEKKYDIQTESMKKGVFFESLWIGDTRDGNLILDLPRKKLKKKERLENEVAISEGRKPPHKGDKMIDQIRIERQVEVAKTVSKNMGMRIETEGPNKNVQIYKKIPFGMYEDELGEVWLEGTADIYDTPIQLGEVYYDRAVVDAKLTGNIHSERKPYCWGIPKEMPHYQGSMYSKIFGLKFVYLVFDYKPVPEWKPIPFSYTAGREHELHEVIRKVASRIRYHQRYGWDVEPKYGRCKVCPLNFTKGGPCQKAQIIEEV